MDMKLEISEAALERYREAVNALEDARQWAENVSEADVENDGADSLGTLVDRMMNLVYHRREMVDEMRHSLYENWGTMTALHGDGYDGDVKKVMVDTAPLSWYWVYPKSGYQGGLIFHPRYTKNPVTGVSEKMPVGTWSIHT